MAASAQKYANKLSSTNCGNLIHSTPEERNGYGENLYISGSTSGNSYSPEKAMNGWYTEEVGDGMNVKSFQGHATQILWKSTKELGCGLATCESSYKYDLLVCMYNKAGNMMSDLLEEVEPFQGEC